jgi:hypothetical protein
MAASCSECMLSACPIARHRGSGGPTPCLRVHGVPRRSRVSGSSALSLMLTLGGALVPPDGCWVVAVAEDGSAVAACTDPHAWFVYDPELTHDALWSLTHEAPLKPASPRHGDEARTCGVDGDWEGVADDGRLDAPHTSCGSCS